jgi:hypothetical protein
VPALKNCARVANLQLGTSSRVNTRRASRAVSTTANAGHGSCCSSAAAFRNLTSNGALWATSTLFRANSRKDGSTAVIGGALATIVSVIPVRTLT